MKQAYFFAEDDRLEILSKMGDPLERVSSVINFELFCHILDEAFK